MKTQNNIYQWFSSSGLIVIDITQSQIDDVCTSGSNDAAVAALQKPQIDPDVLKAELKEYGAWDNDELDDHNANLSRVMWVACWDCFDNPEMYAVN